MVSSKQKTRIKEKNQALLQELWPEGHGPIWTTKGGGYVQLPRTMPLIIEIIDHLTKNTPGGKAYLALWCRVWDVPLVEIKDEKTLAFEAGFTTERAVSTWRSRMKLLKERGFIDAKKGASGDYHYVFVLDPYQAIRKQRSEITDERLYNAFLGRSNEIGAKQEEKEE